MQPSIISPVSRTLHVKDLRKSLAFYTSLPGFHRITEDGTSVRSGAAEINFLEDAYTHQQPREVTTDIVFFETDDVHAMYDLLRAVVTCTPPARVNWIKMEMFSVTDPDGHVLWFGKSFHREYDQLHTVAGEGQLRTIMPVFPCENVPVSVQHYVSALGFTVNFEQSDLAVVDRDSIRMLLVKADHRNAGKAQCYVYIRNADELYAELFAAGATLGGQPVSRPWGLREFVVSDPDGNTISFGQTFE